MRLHINIYMYIWGNLSLGLMCSSAQKGNVCGFISVSACGMANWVGGALSRGKRTEYKEFCILARQKSKCCASLDPDITFHLHIYLDACNNSYCHSSCCCCWRSCSCCETGIPAASSKKRKQGKYFPLT